MDLIAKRFEARYLETEGKVPQALALCREIIAHFEAEPASEDLFPVYLKASELSVTLGDRPAGVAVLVRAAEYFADHGIAPPVIDLCQRLPRLEPTLTRLHLRFARRMLERDHVRAACDLLRDLALRRKKTALRQMLERMAAWPEPIVRGQLLEFLNRADARQPVVAEPEPSPAEVDAAPEPPPPAPPPVRPPPPARQDTPPAPSPAVPPASAPRRGSTVPPGAGTHGRSTGPRTLGNEAAETRETDAPPPPPVPKPAPPIPTPNLPPLPPREVEFVEPAAGEPRHSPRPTRSAAIAPMVPPPRRRRRRAVPWLQIAAAGALVAVGAWLGARFLGSRPPVTAPSLDAPTTAQPPAPAPTLAAMDDSAGAAAPADDTAALMAQPPVEAPPDSVIPVRVTAPPAAVRRDTPAAAMPAARPPQVVAAPPAAAVAVIAPPPEEAARPTTPDTAQQVRPEPEPAPQVDPRPPVLRVDYALVAVGGLEAVSVGIEGEGSSRRVVVRQLLPGGDTLELRAADLGAGSVGVGGGRILVSPHPAGGAMGTTRVGQFLVTARAPLAPEELEPLLRRLVEVRPE